MWPKEPFDGKRRELMEIMEIIEERPTNSCRLSIRNRAKSKLSPTPLNILKRDLTITQICAPKERNNNKKIEFSIKACHP
jgi:hypothetical protein